MIRDSLIGVAVAAALAAPVFAQQPQPGEKSQFISNQTAADWRASKLIGASVYGPDNSSIGEINDLIVGPDGRFTAAVVSVGGYLGVAEKDVALPFEALNISRRPNSPTIDKITVRYSKDELKSAPKFAYFQSSGALQTTGSGTGTAGTLASPPPVPK